MANSHPYISGPGNIAKMIAQLRKSFPQTIDSGTVKRLGLAPKNESHVINALQFVGIIDENGKKTPEAGKVFSHHKDDEFADAFATLVKDAYSALFELHGEGSWEIDTDGLITFFRQSDQTSDAIGRRQANTFKTFAGLSGHGEIPDGRRTKGKSDSTSAKRPKREPHKKSAKKKSDTAADKGKRSSAKEFGLTVRVEINLPAGGSRDVYDTIFKSIKENLIDAE